MLGRSFIGLRSVLLVIFTPAFGLFVSVAALGAVAAIAHRPDALRILEVQALGWPLLVAECVRKLVKKGPSIGAYVFMEGFSRHLLVQTTARHRAPACGPVV